MSVMALARVSDPEDMLEEIRSRRTMKLRRTSLASFTLITVVLCVQWFSPRVSTPQQAHRHRLDLINVADKDEVVGKDIQSEDNKLPRIAWLMSFPNSGTSYTLRMIARTTQTLVATNYAKRESSDHRQLHPVYRDQDGPFWPDPSKSQYRPPPVYVLTKTHCGSRCNGCPPSNYLQKPDAFAHHCLSGSKLEHNNATSGRAHAVKVTYNSSLVHKAVHLVRNPFDNIVSRYHLERHELAKRNRTKLLALFPDSKSGFRRYCHYMNAKYKQEVEAKWLFGKALALQRVPCRDDFYRYISWHNLAFITTDNILDLPTFILHYEDYSGDAFNTTVSNLLTFLNLSQAQEAYPFRQGQSYEDYFTSAEKAFVKEAMKALSVPQMWESMRRYVDEQ